MSNRTRNKEVKIFFNDDEFNKLTDDCNALKLSKSEYIRALVNSNIVNVKNNQEILNSILEIYKLNSKLEKLNTNLENEDINGYELIIKNILDETNKIIKDLKTKKVYNYDINESCKELCVPSEVRIIIKCLSEEGIMLNWVIPYECDESKNS